MVSRCICGWTAKTSRHLFLDCLRVRLVWDNFLRTLGMRAVVVLTPDVLLFHLGAVRHFLEPFSSPFSLFYSVASLEGS